MGLLGTFASFNTARLGIYTSQKGLDITGNNIANINTRGYTRQTLDQISLRTGGHDRYQSTYDVRVGNGSLAVGISQIRDPYLDIRYRSEMSTVGSLDSKLSGLNDLAAILDEVAKGKDENGILDAQFSDFFAALNNLTSYTGEGEFDTQARSAAEALAKLFNKTANDLNEVYDNTITTFLQDLKTVNSILTNIRDLNASIRKSEVHGDPALEQRDERNMLIDQLSEYMKIDVITSMEDIGAGKMVEKLTIRLGGANPDGTVNTDSAVLVDGIYATQIGITQVLKKNPDYDPNAAQGDPGFGEYLKPDGSGTNNKNLAALEDDPNFNLTLSELRNAKGRILNDGKPSQSQPVNLDDNDLYGRLQSTRELLTEEGEFANQDLVNMDEKASTKRGIKYYQKSLDLLANQFAAKMNEANQGYMVDENGFYVDGNGDQVIDPATNNPIKKEFPLTPETEQILKDAGVKKVGGNLFSIRSDSNNGEGITAANISVSKDWSTGAVHIVSSFTRPSGSDGAATTDSSNILHMVALMDTRFDYIPGGDAVSKDSMFHGTFQEMLTNIEGVLGNDIRTTNIQLNNSYTSSVDLDTSRLGVSSVDLNDEAANMMQYQKSYSAACRLMTTLDQLLDKLINGTGVVGL